MDAILSAVPVWGLVALGVLVVIETALDVIALVDLYRRPIGKRHSQDFVVGDRLEPFDASVSVPPAGPGIVQVIRSHWVCREPPSWRWKPRDGLRSSAAPFRAPTR